MSAPITTSESLRDYVRTWDEKPTLRAIYDDFYDRIAAACHPGTSIEIGGGGGNLKRRLKDVIVTDIQYATWLDCVADAQRLPFAAQTATNIIMVDVLHHLEFPVAFFREAERVLHPGGRIVMIEPAITWGSTLFYRLLHREPVRTSANSLTDGHPDPRRDPYESNQAIPTILVTRERDKFWRLFPTLRIARVDWFSFGAYPLSGGFQRWCLIGQRAARIMLRLERLIEPTLGRLAAFRMMLVREGGSELASSLPRLGARVAGVTLLPSNASLQPYARYSGTAAAICFAHLVIETASMLG
jgi:SAM-dependent methyltransferase